MVCGVYIKGGKYNSNSRVYQIWKRMLRRCFDEKFQKQNPWYKGCSVSDEFYHFELFSNWAEQQAGFDKADWQLDKDVLYEGNKIYCREACVFLPSEINRGIHSKSADNGLPRGVELHGNVYRINVGGKIRSLNLTFTSAMSAYETYKEIKEGQVRDMALKYKDELDPRAFEALSKYQFKDKTSCG